MKRKEKEDLLSDLYKLDEKIAEANSKKAALSIIANLITKYEEEI